MSNVVTTGIAAAIAAPPATPHTPPFPFEDLYPKHDGAQPFWCTNEEVELHRELLKGLRLHRVAAIASGGEVALHLLLPRTTGELVLVDHAYLSLAACYAKTQLLNTLGARGLKDLFETGDATTIKKAFQEVASLLPTKLQLRLNISNLYYAHDLRREWHYVSVKALEKSYGKLSKLTFLHGDLTDLQTRGPFDLLYLSNALEHTPRTEVNLRSSLSALVRDGGHILMTGNQCNSRSSYGTPQEWQLKKAIKGYRTSWTHYLYQKV